MPREQRRGVRGSLVARKGDHVAGVLTWGLSGEWHVGVCD